jgi:hypothetical protein
MTCHKCVGAIPAAGLSRRAVLNRFGMGLGGMALASLVNPAELGAAAAQQPDRGILNGQFHVRPKAKRVITCSWPAGRLRWRRSTTSRC